MRPADGHPRRWIRRQRGTTRAAVCPQLGIGGRLVEPLAIPERDQTSGRDAGHDPTARYGVECDVAAGDSFKGVLDEPIVIEGRTVAARGAAVTGRVLAAKASGRLHDPGYLRIALVSLKVGGKPVSVATSSIFAKGGAHQNRNLAMMGGGAGTGALVGGLAGGGKGALIGTGAGAAAGTGAAYATGKKEVSLGEERRLTFRLAQAVDVP